MLIRRSIITALSLLVLVGPAFPAAAQEIVIGEITSLSGRFSKPGESIDQGGELAVFEANKGGGIGGRMLKLVTRDDGGNPQKAIEAAESLCLKEKAVVLTGGYVDSLVGPVAEVAEKNGVPYVAAASLLTKLTGMGLEYFFRISNIQGYVGPMSEVITSLGAKKAVILHSVTPGATELASLLTAELTGKGMKVTAVEKFKPGTSDFTPLLLKAFREKPDILVSLGFFQDNLLMVKQLKENNLSPGAFIGSFGMENQSLIDDLGADSDYLLGTTAWESSVPMPGTEEMSREYVSLFKEKYGDEPEALTMHGYTAARVIIEAMKRLDGEGRPITSQALRDALKKTDILLPMENVQFEANGEPRNYQRFIFQIMGGRRNVLYPSEVRQTDARYPAPSWEKR